MEPWRTLFSLLAPPRCAACGAGCVAAATLCRRCDQALGAARPMLEPGPQGLSVVWASGPHDGVVRELVAALKFRRMLAVADLIAARIAAIAPAELLAASVVPVPASPLRHLRRGFDPAEEIAIRLARLTGLPLVPCLARKEGPRQVGRCREARIAEPPRVRVASPPPRPALLVDDVYTTGATLAACASALLRAGSEEVTAVTFARTL